MYVESTTEDLKEVRRNEAFGYRSLAVPITHSYVERSIMAKLSWFQRMYWRKFSKPAHMRSLIMHVIDHPIGSILEIGIGNGHRIQKILSLYTLREGCSQLRYAGIDPFESGTSSSGHLRLKDVHRMLAERNVKAHLIPGDTSSGLMRVVHTVLPSDLIIIDHGWGDSSAEGEALTKWLPRLVHENSTVFARSNEMDGYDIIAVSPVQSARLAA